jgi:transcription initiation factor IIE alpha subunit
VEYSAVFEPHEAEANGGDCPLCGEPLEMGTQ